MLVRTLCAKYIINVEAHFVGYLYTMGHSGRYFVLKWLNKTQTGCSSETLTVSAVDVVLFDKWITPTINMTIKGKVHPRT